MTTLALAILLTPLVAWALHRDAKRADQRRRIREAMRRPSTPLGRFAAAWREVKDEIRRAMRPAVRAYAEAFSGIAKAFRATEPPPPSPHRWFKVGEPPCECPACTPRAYVAAEESP